MKPKIIIDIKLRRMRWDGHVARMGERRDEVSTEFWWKNLKQTT